MNATPWNKALHFVPVFDEVSMPTSKHRIAVNFPDDEYAELAGLADKHDVLLACLGRQAILKFTSRYRDEQLLLPLRLHGRQNMRAASSVVHVIFLIIKVDH
jgi:hypothetical protein